MRPSLTGLHILWLSGWADTTPCWKTEHSTDGVGDACQWSATISSTRREGSPRRVGRACHPPPSHTSGPFLPVAPHVTAAKAHQLQRPNSAEAAGTAGERHQLYCLISFHVKNTVGGGEAAWKPFAQCKQGKGQDGNCAELASRLVLMVREVELAPLVTGLSKSCGRLLH